MAQLLLYIQYCCGLINDGDHVTWIFIGYHYFGNDYTSKLGFLSHLQCYCCINIQDVCEQAITRKQMKRMGANSSEPIPNFGEDLGYIAMVVRGPNRFRLLHAPKCVAEMVKRVLG